MLRTNIAQTYSSIETPIIDIRKVGKIFPTIRGDRVQALKDISLSIREKEFVAIVGPSGCGKSTLLRILAGLTPATGGTATLNGTPIEKPRPDIGIVFQNAVLLPWRTILQNVLLPSEVQGTPNSVSHPRAHMLLKMVGLADFKTKYPMELSGGMQQRAAITRALVTDPRILLMDEPFGALDAMTREQMNLELQRIWLESEKTVVLITHSIPEAVFLADRVVVMTPRPGRIARIVDIPIPRPRTMDVMGHPEFGRLTSEIRQLLYGDSASSQVDKTVGGID
jgi:NitT/TauT family transport system ATP-binding protein